MAVNKGKQFEDKFKENWKECFPGTLCFRLKDQITGFKDTSQNPSDFLCFPGDNHLYMIECKSHDGASISFTTIPQYERLLGYKDFKNVIPGIVIWFKEKDKVIWCDIWTAEKIYNDGHKSIQLSMLTKNLYSLKELPSVKLRTYMDTDYNALIELYKENN